MNSINSGSFSQNDRRLHLVEKFSDCGMFRLNETEAWSKIIMLSYQLLEIVDSKEAETKN